MSKRTKRNYFEPQRHPDHPRPITRRQLISQGFMSGAATLAMGSAFSLFSNPRAAYAALAGDLEPLKAGCPQIKGNVFNPVPFICFDLAGGANMAGSNVLVGGQGGQFDLLTTQGYSKLGLPGDMVPGVPKRRRPLPVTVTTPIPAWVWPFTVTVRSCAACKKHGSEHRALRQYQRRRYPGALGKRYR